MSKRERTVTERTEHDDSKPDWLQGGDKGTVKLYREPDTYLETIDAAVFTEEAVLRTWGAGDYEARWFPPPEAGQDAKVLRRRFSIAARPGQGRGQAQAADQALQRRIASLETMLREQQAEGVRRRDEEWQRLLATQRDQQGTATKELLALMGGFQQQQQAVQAQAAVDRERAHERAMERANADAAAARERDRAYHSQVLELMKADHNRNADNADGMGAFEKTLSLVGRLKELGLGGEDGKETLTQTVIKAVPGVVEGLSVGYEKAARAAVELKQVEVAQQQQAAQLQAPPPDAHIDEVEDPWLDSPEAVAFTGWLDWLETVPEASWKPTIEHQLTTGTLPAVLQGPLVKALGGDATELVQLFGRVGAGDLLQRALQLLAGGESSAPSGTRGPMEPAGGAGPALALAQVAMGRTQDRPQPNPGAPAHRDPLPHGPGHPGGGPADSSDIEGAG